MILPIRWGIAIAKLIGDHEYPVKHPPSVFLLGTRRACTGSFSWSVGYGRDFTPFDKTRPYSWYRLLVITWESFEGCAYIRVACKLEDMLELQARQQKPTKQSVFTVHPHFNTPLAQHADEHSHPIRCFDQGVYNILLKIRRELLHLDPVSRPHP